MGYCHLRWRETKAGAGRVADPGHEVPRAGCRSRRSLPGAGKGWQVDTRATTALSCGVWGWRDRFAHVWESRGDFPSIPVPIQSQVSPMQLYLCGWRSRLLAPPSSSASCPPHFARPQMQPSKCRAVGFTSPLANKLPQFCDTSPTSSASLVSPFQFVASPHLLSMKNGLAARPTSKGQPSPRCRHAPNESPGGIFGAASTFSCNEHPLADNRSPSQLLPWSCHRGHGSACKGEDSR